MIVYAIMLCKKKKHAETTKWVVQFCKSDAKYTSTAHSKLQSVPLTSQSQTECIIVKPDRKISVPLPSCENRTLCTPGEAICAHSCACTIQLWPFREEQSGLSRETNFVSKMYWYSKIYIRSLSNMQFDFRRRLTQNETSRKIETIAVWKLIFGAIHNEWFCRCNTTSLHGFFAHWLIAIVIKNDGKLKTLQIDSCSRLCLWFWCVRTFTL